MGKPPGGAKGSKAKGGGAGGAKGGTGKHFFPSKTKKKGIADWIPEAKELIEATKYKREPKTNNKSGSKKDLICLWCRKTGHNMKRCPENKERSSKQKTQCYKCGGTDHSVWDCTVEDDAAGGKFAFAACFVCGEKGHISRECPQNSRGIYVNGGHCKICKSTAHLIKDCPQLPEHRRGPKPNSHNLLIGEESGSGRQRATRGDLQKKVHLKLSGDDLEDDFGGNLSDTEGGGDDGDPGDTGAGLDLKAKGDKGKGKGHVKAGPKVVKF